jgi:putative flippase GtrA
VKLLKYFIVGGVAAFVDVGGFLWLTGPIRAHWFAASCASFIVATFANYVLSVTFVFESGARFRRHHEIGLVFLVSLVGLACNQIVLGLMIEKIGASQIVAKFVATSAVFFWNYGARRHFVFPGTNSIG